LIAEATALPWELLQEGQQSPHAIGVSDNPMLSGNVIDVVLLDRSEDLDSMTGTANLRLAHAAVNAAPALIAAVKAARHELDHQRRVMARMDEAIDALMEHSADMPSAMYVCADRVRDVHHAASGFENIKAALEDL
jgi:hypothetical protein